MIAAAQIALHALALFFTWAAAMGFATSSKPGIIISAILAVVFFIAAAVWRICA